MTRKRLGLLLAAAILGLATGACVHEPPGSPAAELMARGESVYIAHCAACHQPDGKGIPGTFPPLADSDYLQGDRYQVMAAALFGLSGPVTVNGIDYDVAMPSIGYLPDEDLAAALTYVFGSWGNDFPPVTVEEVASIRAELGEDEASPLR